MLFAVGTLGAVTGVYLAYDENNYGLGAYRLVLGFGSLAMHCFSIDLVPPETEDTTDYTHAFVVGQPAPNQLGNGVMANPALRRSLEVIPPEEGCMDVFAHTQVIPDGKGGWSSIGLNNFTLEDGIVYGLDPRQTSTMLNTCIADSGEEIHTIRMFVCHGADDIVFSATGADAEFSGKPIGQWVANYTGKTVVAYKGGFQGDLWANGLMEEVTFYPEKQ
jgi:hypothetical protein